MAKRLPASRSGRGDGAFVRVSGAIADFLGIKPSAGRYIAREALEPLQVAAEVWKQAAGTIGDAVEAGEDAANDAIRSMRDLFRARTVSNRQRSTASLRNRTGEQEITREKYTLEVKTGRRRYTSEETAERQSRASEGKAIRKQIPEIAPADARIVVKFKTEGGYAALDDDEKERFEMLFKRYPKESVREALGSPKRRRHERRRVNNERTIPRNMPSFLRPARRRNQG